MGAIASLENIHGLQQYSKVQPGINKHSLLARIQDLEIEYMFSGSEL
jgi:hypothetical protein